LTISQDEKVKKNEYKCRVVENKSNPKIGGDKKSKGKGRERKGELIRRRDVELNTMLLRDQVVLHGSTHLSLWKPSSRDITARKRKTGGQGSWRPIPDSKYVLFINGSLSFNLLSPPFILPPFTRKDSSHVMYLTKE
jgi:hypothetical protein